MSSDVKWIKITTNIFNDEKMLLIESMPSADSIIVIWFKLLILAGKTNNHGVFFMSDRIPYTDEMPASIFRRDVNTVRLALTTFEKLGMVEIVDNVITIPNWDKHQTLDSYEKRKERDRLYSQKRREAQKALIGEKSADASPTHDRPVVDSSPSVVISDIDKDLDIDNNEKTAHARAREEDFPPKTFGEELTDEDVAASLNLTQWIEDLAFKWGLPKSPGNLQQALDIYREFEDCPKDWFEIAVERAGSKDATKSWYYVRGVLRNAKQKGDIHLDGRPGKTGAESCSAQDAARAELEELGILVPYV